VNQTELNYKDHHDAKYKKRKRSEATGINLSDKENRQGPLGNLKDCKTDKEISKKQPNMKEKE